MGESYLNAVKGERSMSRGFIAQYAAEAALQTEGVARLEPGGAAMIREALGIEPESHGVQVFFRSDAESAVSITVYAVIEFGQMVPEVAWRIQEQVKEDVERYTDLMVETVNVHVVDIVAPSEPLEDDEPEAMTKASM